MTRRDPTKLAWIAAFAVMCRTVALAQVPLPLPPVYYQERLSDEVVAEVVLTAQQDVLVVELRQPFEHSRRRRGERSALSKSQTQVWLLRTNGSALKQYPIGSNPYFDFGANDEAVRMYWFEKVPASDIAGIALSVNGRFYLRKVDPK